MERSWRKSTIEAATTEMHQLRKGKRELFFVSFVARDEKRRTEFWSNHAT
jgi:hypothetical protein